MFVFSDSGCPIISQWRWVFLKWPRPLKYWTTVCLQPGTESIKQQESPRILCFRRSFVLWEVVLKPGANVCVCLCVSGCVTHISSFVTCQPVKRVSCWGTRTLQGNLRPCLIIYLFLIWNLFKHQNIFTWMKLIHLKHWNWARLDLGLEVQLLANVTRLTDGTSDHLLLAKTWPSGDHRGQGHHPPMFRYWWQEVMSKLAVLLLYGRLPCVLTHTHASVCSQTNIHTHTPDHEVSRWGQNDGKKKNIAVF